MKYGKSVLVWKGVLNCFGGDISHTIDFLKMMGVEMVILKIGDAAGNHSSSYPNMLMAVSMFKKAGIRVAIWHYVYGGAYKTTLGVTKYDWHSPEQEAAFAVYWIGLLDPEIYVIDAEYQYTLGFDSVQRILRPSSRAGRFMAGLKDVKCKVALSSYRYPKLHQDFPFETFLNSGRGCDLHMPQVYWGDYSDAGSLELERSIVQLKPYKNIPFLPIGRAYIGDGHSNRATLASQILNFGREAIAQDTEGISFWVLDQIIKYDPGNWQTAISAIPIKSGASDPVEPTPELTLSELNKKVNDLEAKLLAHIG